MLTVVWQCIPRYPDVSVLKGLGTALKAHLPYHVKALPLHRSQQASQMALLFGHAGKQRDSVPNLMGMRTEQAQRSMHGTKVGKLIP